MPPIDFSQLPLAFLVLVASLTVHEAAHAWSADLMGDPTPSRHGRVSLSPAAHFDLIGMVAFPLAAKLTGLSLVGWGRPVPLSPAGLGPRWRRKSVLIWVAGPVSNLAVASLAAGLFRLAPAAGLPLDGAIAIVVWQAIQLNVLLAIVNLIPVPPLDAGNILAGMLSGRAGATFERLRPFCPLVLCGLLFTGVLSRIVSPVQGTVVAFLL